MSTPSPSDLHGQRFFVVTDRRVLEAQLERIDGDTIHVWVHPGWGRRPPTESAAGRWSTTIDRIRLTESEAISLYVELRSGDAPQVVYLRG